MPMNSLKIMPGIGNLPEMKKAIFSDGLFENVYVIRVNSP
jgi:hypothetical protein